MKIESIRIENPDGKNIILGQSHFIKTVEDLHEILVSSVPGIRFGLAFSEASGECLIRTTGTDEKLTDLAAKNLQKMSAGHTFLIFLENAFPINVLNSVKLCPEVVRVFCATANPVDVIVAHTGQGGAILGVVDGRGPKGIETKDDRKKRMAFIRSIGYKLG